MHFWGQSSVPIQFLKCVLHRLPEGNPQVFGPMKHYVVYPLNCLVYQAKLGQTVEQDIQGNSRLGAGQRRAKAEVDAAAEAAVLAVLTPQIEDIGVRCC